MNFYATVIAYANKLLSKAYVKLAVYINNIITISYVFKKPIQNRYFRQWDLSISIFSFS